MADRMSVIFYLFPLTFGVVAGAVIGVWTARNAEARNATETAKSP
jgi:hypothetical protein